MESWQEGHDTTDEMVEGVSAILDEYDIEMLERL